MRGIASQADVLAIEAPGLPADLPTSTYEMIRRGAAIDPAGPALSFFLDANDHRDAECWTYGELVRDITRTANMGIYLLATSNLYRRSLSVKPPSSCRARALVGRVHSEEDPRRDRPV